MLAEHRDLVLTGRFAVREPADREVEVPAHPGPDLIAPVVKLSERRLLPEAVEHAIGEQFEIRPLDDPAEDLATRERLHLAKYGP